MDQTFNNDSNVQINSPALSSIHNIIWNGLLPVSRGGTGAGSFSAGSILFSNGTTFAEDNSNFFWDNTNKSLRLGTESTPGIIRGENATTTDTTGGLIQIISGNGEGAGFGGRLDLLSGDGGTTGDGGSLNIDPGDGGTTSGNGGSVSVTAGSAHGIGNGGSFEVQGGGGGDVSGNGGNISFWPGQAQVGLNGHVEIVNPTSLLKAIFDTTSLAGDDRTFTFPNTSGTFGLLQANQTWSGLNKFEASTNSTIYVGSSVKSGCIAMGDSDDRGITYITANDGVLTASSTKPNICQ
jgi:hypothetical protein